MNRVFFEIDAVRALPLADEQQDLEVVLVRLLYELVLPQVSGEGIQIEITLLGCTRIKVPDLVYRQMIFRLRTSIKK